MARNVTECQQRLIDTGYLPPLNAKGETNADGKFGHDSLDAYNHFRATMGKGPLVQVSMAELNADLFPTEHPAPVVVPARKPSLFDQIGAAASIIKTLKGLSMTNTNISPSANVDVKSAWLSKLNWTMAAGVLFNIAMLFGHPVPPDIQAAVTTVGNSAFLILGYVIKTFFTKTITPSSAAKI